MFSLLPTSLLALLYASPALAVPTTPNDAFRALALVAPKAPEEPICCLRPLPSLEPPAEEDILLSFEDWKAKRSSEHNISPPIHKPPENLSESSGAIPPDPSHSSPQTQTQQPVQVDVQEHGAPPPERLAPQLRIPITDRFNYASLDCSARVHAAHKSAKSASAILSSKKDRYMLSPCGEARQFVIVELCEDIRIDTVQLANYEFFSGVFKDFSVSVAKQYTADPKEWVHAGTYRAKNVRGVQSFHPPPTLRDFYRIIRIDFHSHYGSEYYCPLSLLRVYGLTQLEEWQWETWEAESRAKRSVEEASPPIEVVAEPPKPAQSSPPDPVSTANGSIPSSPVANGSDDSAMAGTPNITTDSIPTATDIPSSPNVTPASSSSTVDSASHPPPDSLPPKSETLDVSYDSSRLRSDPVYHTPVSLSSSSPSSHAHSTASDNHSSSIFIDLTQSSSSSSSSSSSHPASPSSRISAAAPDASSLSTLSTSYSPPASTGGESIYRTIMNRLTALEANTTLYARYVEEQTTGMRDVLRRLTEDLGRLEGIGKAQAQLYHRSVVELEKQTQRLEAEQRLLLYRVNYLTDEVILEKRLGIAQLCLLLIVLVFMALTRGSRGEYVPPPETRLSVRDWGRRTLSFSGELVNRFRGSSTPPRTASNSKAGENEITFPTLDLRPNDEVPRSRRPHHATTGSGSSSRGRTARPHTPTATRHFAHNHHHRVGGGGALSLSPASLHALRPAIQRSNSGGWGGGGGVGPVPRSAKRWARSAHLHEVKSARRPDADDDRDGGRDGDREATPVPTAPSSAEDEADAQILLVPPELERMDIGGEGNGHGKGKGKARARMYAAAPMVRQPSPLRHADMDMGAIDLASPPVRPVSLAGSGETSEWVDTDVSGSECESVGNGLGDGDGQALDSAGLRERTFVRPTNSSL